MAQLNKEKIAEINRKKYIKTYKRVERSTSANNDSSTVNTRNWRSKPTDEPKSKKTVLTSRKRRPTADAPLNGSLARVSGKNSRKLTKKAKTTAKGKSGGSTNGGGGTRKLAKKNVETNDSEMGADDEKEYEIEKVVGEKMVKGVRHFLVRWKGYTEASNTWEPLHTLFYKELIEEYRSEVKLKTLSKKQKKSSSAGARRKLPGRNPVDEKTDSEPDSEKEWEVQQILGHFSEGSDRYYKIRWKGYSSQHDCWEPEKNLRCNELIAKYHKIIADKAKKTQGLVNETTPRSSQRLVTEVCASVLLWLVALLRFLRR